MKIFLKIMWALGGIILILCGCSAFFNPMAGMVAFQTIIGAGLIISGILSIIGYAATQKILMGAGWILADGIMSLIFGGLIIFAMTYSDMLTAEFTAVVSVFIAVIIGVWLITTGVGQITRAVDLHKHNEKGWGWGIFFGIVSLLCAGAMFCKPVVMAMGTLSVFMGIILIVGGVSLVSRCFAR